jgi:energy-coupling factor transporter ATP-binding protein EcfA2
MIRRLRLVHYKGFSDFTVHFGERSLLIGPNNAGKTTIVTSLRICTLLLNYARRRRAEFRIRDESRQRWVQAYPLRLPGGRFAFENLRHEFREAETRLELTFRNKAMLYAVWPPDAEPYFYLEHIEGMQPSSISVVKKYYSSVGVVPTLTPVEHGEKVLSEEHIESSLGTRLVSRHFRNQLYYTKVANAADYTELVDYLLANTSEVETASLIDTYTAEGDHVLDWYLREAQTHTEKELYWVGDGLQIWLQVLFHLWRQRSYESIVLDEPDVFLHPDLQRRLVRLLEDDYQQQIIMATHAPEMLTEASRDSVVIVDRTRKSSRRVSDERVLADLNDTLGSGFNLRLARALRSRVVLFVEGHDMKVLRNLAKTVGAQRVRAEQGLSIVPLEGFSKWRSAEAYSWLNQTFLERAVRMIVVLDRDYRTDETVHDLKESLSQAGIESHVWEKKELESYLLIPEAMARISGVTLAVMQGLIDEAASSLRTKVFARYLEERQETERSGRRHAVSVTETYTPIFDEMWRHEEIRIAMVPPKEVLHSVNQKLQDLGANAVSIPNLSNRIRRDEVVPEMRDFLLRIDGYLTPAPYYLQSARG